MLVSLGLGLSTLASVALNRGQHPPPDRRPDALRRALVLLHRHPERPDGPVSRGGRWDQGRDRLARRAKPAGASRRRRRGAGRSSGGHARHALGAAWRSWVDVCGGAAGGDEARRRDMVAGGLSWAAAGLVRRQPRAWLGRASRQRAAGQRARARHRPQGGEPARHRLAYAGAQLHARRQSRPARPRTAHAHRHPPRAGRGANRRFCGR